MNRSALLTIILLFLIATPLPAREGYNEPPRPPSTDSTGLLRINRDFFKLSADTGGDFYFWAPGEFAASAATLSIPVNTDPILLDYGNAGRFAGSYSIPVDSGIAQISVFVGAQRKESVLLRRPDGRSISANSALVTEQSYRHMSIIMVEKPEPGTWRLDFGGGGAYSVSVRYSCGKRKDPALKGKYIDLLDVEFVEWRGRPGHEGLFPVKGKVRAGDSHLYRITADGPIFKPVCEFVSRDNKIVGRCSLQAADGDFIGTCTVPSVPFRTRLKGRDADGHGFQRISSAIYTPTL